MGGGTETLEFLCRAETRLALLRELKDEPLSRAALEADLDRPKATVARNLANLAERCLMVRAAGAYRLTPTGQIAVGGIEAIGETLGGSDALETLAFLGQAEARLAILRELARERLTRDALMDMTGVPRKTIHRVLADLEGAGFVRRQGREYALTPSGEGVAAVVDDLLSRLGTMGRLRSLEPWLPTAAFGFDLPALSSARITLPTPADPLAPVDRAYAVLLDADRYWLLSRSATPDTLEACWRAVGDRRCAIVVTRPVVDVMAVEPTLTRRLAEQDEPDGYRLAVLDGVAPVDLAIANDTVVLRVQDESGAVKGLIESDDDAVRAWAEGIKERSADMAEPLATADLGTIDSSPDAAGDPSIIERIRRTYEGAWGGDGDLDLIDDYVAPGFVRHMAYNPEAHGPAEYRALVERYRDAFPNADCAVEEIVPKGDRYFFRWRAWGTQVGEFAGLEPSCEHVEFSGVTMARFEDGRCVEE